MLEPMAVSIVHVISGLLVGIAMARAHLAMSSRAARASLRSGRAWWALIGFPVRVGVTAFVLFALTAWSTTAMLAALAGFAISHRLWLRRLLVPRSEDAS